MENNGIVNIEIEKIYPHPDNPRKELGDLTELAESIKKNGVMQNLTVIPGHQLTDEEWKVLSKKYAENPDEDLRQEMNSKHSKEGYTLLIGHRRCAAAKLAGIKKMPCRIVDGLDKKEQMSTMLEENMQRNDLTIWEQANGFQMMLDLGDTEDQIAEKTGFSKTTIRHRLNIAKLDQKELKKKEQNENFQLTLTDLYALEKVEDIVTRNKILKESSNSRELIWKAQSAADEAVRQKKINEIVKLLKVAGIEKAPERAEKEQYFCSGKWETIKEYSLDKEVPKRLSLPKSSKAPLYYLPYYRTVRVIRKADKKPETDEDKSRKETEKKKKQIRARMMELNARKHDFISHVISGKIAPVKETAEVQEEIWKVLAFMGAYLSKSSMANFFTGKNDYACTEEERDKAYKRVEECSVLHQMMLMVDYGVDRMGDLYDWQGKFNEKTGKKLQQAFNVLKRYGWTFEGDEEQLLNGTHELFVKGI